MAGGSITISSLGHIGGTGFTPIINAPEVAVLGVSRLQVRAAPAPDGGVMWRKMLPLSLSYDHRVINGAEAARFVCTIGSSLAGIDTFS
jgi:pyruvate dehydrogenase E2 component (dihydrolipoamide acetyltransferase)